MTTDLAASEGALMDTATTVDPPVADWIDPRELMIDPYPSYARLRELGPVVFAPVMGRYLLTSHAAVREAEQQPERFSSYSETNLLLMRAVGGRPMNRKDDPEHAAERGAINPTLRPRQVADVWSPRFAETVERWIDRLLEIGPDGADLNRDFAAPIASQNLIDLVGFPEGVDVEDMRRWSADFVAGTGNILDDADIWARCDRSRAEVDAILDEVIPALRRRPDASITSHLIEVGLPEAAVRANVFLTISGGMNEPQHMVSNMVWALSTHPEQRAAALNGSVAWGDVFEETVRWISPIGLAPRETTTDLDWFGARIPAGSNIGLLLASANRDPEVFADPDRYDVHRVARGHLGFGGGVHLCAGRWAAKAAVGEIAVPRLYARIPGLELDARRAPSWDGWIFRGLTSLPVTWD